MCGRLTLTARLEEIIEQFSIINSISFPYEAKYNVAPSQNLLAIVGTSAGNRLGQLRWGLIPSWANDSKIGYKMINARAETLSEKRSFKPLLARRRCAIIADGFYEWKNTSKGKTPFRITLKDESPFIMAGLWDSWQNEDGKKVNSCTIITTKSNELLDPIHDRMPVILSSEAEKIWLDPSLNNNEIQHKVLKPYSSNEMKMYEVSQLVNSPKNDLIDCMLPVN
jgi:putative SOS response-associated peptidase YedK